MERIIVGVWVLILCIALHFKDVVGQRYVVSTETVNWFQSLINCKSAGMELASVHSEEEANALKQFLKENGHKAGYWLAGTKLGNGKYYWASTGTKIVYTDWLVGQPDDAKTEFNKREGEHCIQMGMPYYSPNPNGWNDLGCLAELQYICQPTEICYESNSIL